MELFNELATDTKLLACGLDEVTNYTPHALVINASGAGHQDKAFGLSLDIFTDTSLAYDLSYGDAAKLFIDAANKADVPTCVDGLGMLVEQAAFSFAYWKQQMPSTDPVYDVLRSELATA